MDKSVAWKRKQRSQRSQTHLRRKRTTRRTMNKNDESERHDGRWIRTTKANDTTDTNVAMAKKKKVPYPFTMKAERHGG
jgi:hypothetical protein